MGWACTGYYYLVAAGDELTDLYRNRLISVQLLNENRAMLEAIGENVYDAIINNDEQRDQSILNDTNIKK